MDAGTYPQGNKLTAWGVNRRGKGEDEPNKIASLVACRAGPKDHRFRRQVRDLIDSLASARSQEKDQIAALFLAVLAKFTDRENGGLF